MQLKKSGVTKAVVPPTSHVSRRDEKAAPVYSRSPPLRYLTKIPLVIRDSRPDLTNSSHVTMINTRQAPLMISMHSLYLGDLLYIVWGNRTDEMSIVRRITFLFLLSGQAQWTSPSLSSNRKYQNATGESPS
jgi:hypothetical protein